MGSLALASSIIPQYHLPVNPPMLKCRTRFNSKSNCNRKAQLTAFCCSGGKGEYGGWDDFGPSNSLKWKNGIVGDWLQNWENDRGKSLIVMGFGVLFAWSVARPRALWWVCLPLCGFMVLLFFHDCTMQDDSSSSSFNTTPSSNRISSEHDRIRIQSSLSNQVAILSNVILRFLSLDKSAQETLPMHNDISFGEFLQYLKAAFQKSNKYTQPESLSKEVKLEPQIWRRILEEDELVGSDVSDLKLRHTVSKPSTIISGAKNITVGESKTLRKSSELGTKDSITNGYSQQSSFAELGQDKLDERKNLSGPVESEDRQINSVDPVKSRKRDNNQGEKWRRQISSQNLDECATEEHSTTNCGNDREQFPYKEGSVFQQLGRSKQLDELGKEGKQRSADNRGIISQSADHLDEEYAVKNLKRLDVLQNYKIRKYQALRNHDDVPMQSRGIKQRIGNPLTSSAAENKDSWKEDRILETDKPSSACLDESNIIQNSFHLSEASKIEEPGTSIQGGSHESRGNDNDRYGEQDTVAEKRSLVDNSDSDCYAQTAVDWIKVAANSHQSDHSESFEAQNLPSSENLKKKNFQMCLDKGGALLKEAKKGLRGKAEVGDTESMLYEAADIFSTAAALNPSSLAAVGQWGNALLVHGELKLKISQKLRSLLRSRNDSLSEKEQRYQPEELRLAMTDIEIIAETLHEVCEECEKLLVEAGRKYQKALMMDKYDVRSLYNWGLALCFRAQLSSGGGERALKNADKIYVAAIDKFEAMMGISQSYAPDALFSWGLASRNRSRMRPMGSKERTRLLQQARQLFEDALKFNPNHAQAKTAAISCKDELKELEYALYQTRRRERLRHNVSWNMD